MPSSRDLSVVLHTPRLLLRPVETTDIPAIVAALNDYPVASMLSRVPYPYRTADAEWWVARSRCLREAGEALALMIEVDGEGAGMIGLDGLPAPSQIGYWSARHVWGRGIMTEALAWFLAHAFGRLGVDRIPSSVFTDNRASLRVQRKLGFAIEGTSECYSLARRAHVTVIETAATGERFAASPGRGAATTSP